MKSFIYIFALFFSVALLTSCLDPSEKNKDDEPYSIELVNDVVVLSADETQKPNSIEFTVSDDWYIAPETNPETEYKGSDWVTVDTEHGSKAYTPSGLSPKLISVVKKERLHSGSPVAKTVLLSL